MSYQVGHCDGNGYLALAGPCGSPASGASMNRARSTVFGHRILRDHVGVRCPKPGSCRHRSQPRGGVASAISEAERLTGAVRHEYDQKMTWESVR